MSAKLGSSGDEEKMQNLEVLIKVRSLLLRIFKVVAVSERHKAYLSFQYRVDSLPKHCDRQIPCYQHTRKAYGLTRVTTLSTASLVTPLVVVVIRDIPRRKAASTVSLVNEMLGFFRSVCWAKSSYVCDIQA